MSFLDTPSERGQCLRVLFPWRVDRFGHTILWRRDEETAPLLTSLEGDAADWWPPSPPLQQLSVERLPGGRQVALLVGMAGRTHWSLSVLPDAVRPEIVFEVACRANQAPERLGSCYQVFAAPPQLSSASAVVGGAASAPSAACRLVVEPPSAESATRLVMRDSDLRIQHDAAGGRLPATFRWTYRVILLASP